MLGSAWNIYHISLCVPNLLWLMPIPSASSKIFDHAQFFLTRLNFFDHVQYFLNTSKFFESDILPFTLAKLFECSQKYLNAVKKYLNVVKKYLN